MRYLITLLLLFSTISTSYSREITLINNRWQYFTPSAQSADEAIYIELPHTLPTSQSGVNYLREIYAPSEWRDSRIFIRFKGVQRSADIFINGRHAGEHRGGATAFTIEMTDFLRLNQNNTLVVVVNSAPQSDLLPTSVEHDVYGGIYRDVEIITTPKVAISPLYYSSDGILVTTTTATPQVAKGSVEVHLLQSPDVSSTLRLSISDMEGTVLLSKEVKHTTKGGDVAEIPFEISNPRLWSPSAPNLYNFTVTLSTKAQREDVVSVRSGFRTIEAIDGNSIKINGEHTTIKGVSLYHDHPRVKGALTTKEYDQSMTFVKELGATALRSVVYPHDRYLYDRCDESGVLVWVDSPLHRAPFLTDIAYYPTPRYEENGAEQLREIIVQNYNHPSIIMWGIFSLPSIRREECYAYISKLNDIAAQMDHTRLSVGMNNQDSEINTITDLMVWRQDLGWRHGLLSDIDMWCGRLQSIWRYMASGVCYGEGGNILHQSTIDENARRREGGKEWLPEGRQRIFHEKYASVLNDNTAFWGVWLSALFDYKSARRPSGENMSGLVSFNRESRKDVFYLYKALWNNSEPTLYIADRRNNTIHTPTTTIHVYSSDDSTPITLHIGEETFAMERVAPSQFVAYDIPINGRCTVEVRQGELSDMVEYYFCAE